MNLSEDHSDKSPRFYEENGKMGLKKNSRKHITPAIYDTLIRLNDNRYVGKRYSSNKQLSLWGLLSNNGSVVLPFQFFTCEITGMHVILGSAENNRVRKGVYDFEGNQVISNRYENIKITADHIIGRNGNENNIFTIEGTKLKEYRADSVEFLDRNYLTVYHDGKAGVESIDNSVSLPSQYEAVKIEGEAIYGKPFPRWLLVQGFDTTVFHRQNIKAWGGNIIASAGNKSQLINREKAKLSVAYDLIQPVSEQLAKVRLDDRWGVIDNNGQEIIPVQYASILAQKEIIGAKAVSNLPKWSVFDHYGYLKTKLIYDSLKVMNEGRIPVKRNGRWGYLDRYGVEIISPIFEAADDFRNEQAHVRFFGQSGIIDRSGKWVVPPINRKIIDFNSKIVLTKHNKQYQVLSYDDKLIYFTRNTLELSAAGVEELDSLGNFIRRISWEGTILSDIYSGESVRTGGSGLTIFKDKGRYGFKDQQGRIIIANRYEAVKPFHEGMAAIMIRNKWGFIDLDEIIRIQPMYDSVGHFIDGTCLVKRNGLTGVIDINSNEIIDPQYTRVIRLNDNSYEVSVNGKWGLISDSGAVIIHANYDVLKPTDQGYFIVSRNGLYGSIDDSGVNEIPILYAYIDFDPITRTLIIKEDTKEKWAFIMKTHRAN